MTLSKPLRIVFIIHAVLGLAYFYFRELVPIEITNPWITGIFIISLLVSPLMVGVALYTLFPDKVQKNKTLRLSFASFIQCFVIHNLIWTALLIYPTNTAEILSVQYPDPGDKKHKIIREYNDEGVLGGYYSEVEVYEVTPFLNYIY